MSHSPYIVLDPEELELLDRATRIAYSQLIDSGAVRGGQQLYKSRDLAVAVMVRAICRGEKDVWRIARRAIFAVSEFFAPEWHIEKPYIPTPHIHAIKSVSCSAEICVQKASEILYKSL
jgi:hypothetical protein